MATAITASVVVATSNYPAHVEVSVTGAPTPPTNAYTSNFTAGVDSWTVTSGGGSVTRNASYNFLVVKGAASTTTPTYVHRSISGLTIGAQYRYKAFTPGGYTRLGKFMTRVRATTGGADVATTTWLQPYNNRDGYTAELLFTATATTMVIQIGVMYEPAGYAAEYSFGWITVQPSGSWTPPSLHRTDVNGGDVILDLYRNGAAEPATASYTIYDWEAAHLGTIQYALVDGLGAVANASINDAGGEFWYVNATAPILVNPSTGRMLYSGAWATTTPDWVDIEMVTDYDASRQFNGSVHTIIGRSDKIANPGPLMTRSGALTLWCSNYTKALSVEAMIESGDPLFLAQRDFPGMDMYFISDSVSVRPEQATSGGRKWTVTVNFEEVLR